MEALAARLAVVARLGAFPERLGSAARAVAEAEAASGPPDGEWKPRDVVAHLVAVEGVVWQARLDTLGADGADGADAVEPAGADAVEPAGADAVEPAGADAVEPAWTWTEPGPIGDPSAATLDATLALFSAGRALTLSRLQALDDDGWARTGVHATFGRLDVAGLMRVAADHDEEHLAALKGRAG